jgi:hypothetical protein
MHTNCDPTPNIYIHSFAQNSCQTLLIFSKFSIHTKYLHDRKYRYPEPYIFLFFLSFIITERRNVINDEVPIDTSLENSDSVSSVRIEKRPSCKVHLEHSAALHIFSEQNERIADTKGCSGMVCIREDVGLGGWKIENVT